MKRILQKILAVAILFGFFAGWLFVIGNAYELYKLKAVQNWPEGRGVLTHSYARQTRGFQNRKFWDVEIVGIYHGTGQKFSVNRVGYGVEQSICTRKRAEAVVARYPVGSEVTLYSNPDRPSEAILVRDNPPGPTRIALAIGLFFGLLPFLLYIYGRLTGYRPET